MLVLKAALIMTQKHFWKNVSKIANNKSAKFANKIGEAIGESDIWKLARSLQSTV